MPPSRKGFFPDTLCNLGNIQYYGYAEKLLLSRLKDVSRVRISKDNVPSFALKIDVKEPPRKSLEQPGKNINNLYPQ